MVCLLKSFQNNVFLLYKLGLAGSKKIKDAVVTLPSWQNTAQKLVAFVLYQPIMVVLIKIK